MYHLLVNCSRWSWFLPAQLHFDVVYKFLAILSLYLRPVQSSALSLSSFVKFATDAINMIFRARILMLQILKSLWCCCIWYTCDLRKDNSFPLATLSFFFCYICYFLQQLLLLLACNFVAEDKIVAASFCYHAFNAGCKFSFTRPLTCWLCRLSFGWVIGRWCV